MRSKHIIVTGSSGNLGVTVISHLLNENFFIHTVVGQQNLSGITSHKQLTSTQVDLLNEEKARQFVASTLNQNPDIEAVICIVGGFTQGNIDDTTSASIQKMIELNFNSAYHLIRPLIKHHRQLKKPLQIILIGARPAIEPEQGKTMVAYALSKSLLFRLAEMINTDTNRTGISAAVIVPSTLNTPGTRKAMPEIDSAEWVPTTNVAETISFILSATGRMMRQGIYKIYNRA